MKINCNIYVCEKNNSISTIINNICETASMSKRDIMFFFPDKTNYRALTTVLSKKLEAYTCSNRKGLNFAKIELINGSKIEVVDIINPALTCGRKATDVYILNDNLTEEELQEFMFMLLNKEDATMNIFTNMNREIDNTLIANFKKIII